MNSNVIRRLRRPPSLLALYVIAFLDRINIGFAALTMNNELAISSQQFGFAAGVSLFTCALLALFLPKRGHAVLQTRA